MNSTAETGLTESRRLLKSHFFRNVVMVTSGTAVAQLITFALIPVLSRVFSPAEFGVFGSFGAVLSVMTAGITLQYSQALILPKEESKAADLFVVSVLTVLAMSAGVAAAGALFPETVLGLFKGQAFRWMLWLLPLVVLISGLNQALHAWCVRRKAFRRTAFSQVARSLVAPGTQILLGSTGFGVGALAGGMAIGDMAANATLTRAVSRDECRLFRDALRSRSLWCSAREYLDFATYATPQAVMNTASQGAPILLLAHFYGAAVAGSYALATRALQSPMNLILGSLRQVLLQKATEIYNSGMPLFPLLYKSTLGLFAIVILPACVGFIFAPKAFVLFLGAGWLEAGLYARWLILWLACMFCNLPAVLLGRILRQQRALLIFDAVLLVIRILSLVVGGLLLTPLQTIILFSLVGAVFNVAIIGWLGRIVWVMNKQG